MRTALEFNTKYINYLENNEGGLIIDIPHVVHYLDYYFEQLIKIENFKYEKILTIHGIPKIRTNLQELLGNIGNIIQKELEENLMIILKVEYELEHRLASLNLDKNGKSIQSI